MLFWHPHPDLLLAIFIGHTLLLKENLGVWFEYLEVDIRFYRYNVACMLECCDRMFEVIKSTEM